MKSSAGQSHSAPQTKAAKAAAEARRVAANLASAPSAGAFGSVVLMTSLI